MRRVSKAVALSVVVVCLGAAPSFAGLNGKPSRPKKTTNPIVALLRQFAARVFDGGDMSVPRP